MNAAEKVRLFACNLGELEDLLSRSGDGEEIPVGELEQAAREVLLVAPTFPELAEARSLAGLPAVTFAPEVLEDYVNAARVLALAVAPEGTIQ